MKFAFISPTNLIRALGIDGETFHLTLAHLINDAGQNQYSSIYTQIKRDSPDTLIIMDNSGYEMYSTGQPMYPANKLIDKASMIGADVIVLPDYPDSPTHMTREAAIKYGTEFKEAGFQTFYVPQSNIGDRQGLIYEYIWALQSPLIDYIGFSILNIPNAYGCYTNPLQRYLARWTFVNELNQEVFIRFGLTLDQMKAKYNKKFHFLGMLDGPGEIDLMATLKTFTIDTWDSSSPVWAGVESVEYDSSPTGLYNGKVKSHVDFDYQLDKPSSLQINMINTNMDIIDFKVKCYNVSRRQSDTHYELKSPSVFSRGEREALNDIETFLQSTYSQHYVGETDIQTQDVWQTLGTKFTTARDTAIKYMMRIGKKEGYNYKDLLKTVHYLVMMMSEFKRQGLGDKK